MGVQPSPTVPFPNQPKWFAWFVQGDVYHRGVDRPPKGVGVLPLELGKSKDVVSIRKGIEDDYLTKKKGVRTLVSNDFGLRLFIGMSLLH